MKTIVLFLVLVAACLAGELICRVVERRRRDSFKRLFDERVKAFPDLCLICVMHRYGVAYEHVDPLVPPPAHSNCPENLSPSERKHRAEIQEWRDERGFGPIPPPTAD